MIAMTAEERFKAFERSPETWTQSERHEIYWWYYHEVEEPTEEQLRHFSRRQSIHWYGFLLEKLPTTENFRLLRVQYCGNKAGRQHVNSFLKKLLFGEKKPSIALLRMVILYPHFGKAVRKKAKILLEEALQWSDYQI